MTRRRTIWGVCAAVAAAALVLAAGICAAVRATAAPASRLVLADYGIEHLPCAQLGHVAVGAGCADESSITASEWSISDGSATWTVAGRWRNTYHWTAPRSIPDAGTSIQISVTVSSQSGGVCGQITEEGGQGLGQAANACADSGKTASKSLTAQFVPLSFSNVVVLTIGIGDGPTILYFYRPGGSPPATSTATTTTTPTPAGRCPLPSWLRHGRRLQTAGAINEVHVVNVCPDVQFHKGGTPADAWLPLDKDQVLKAGDEITCDPDGAATLAFADSSTVTVRNTTQLKIGSFFTEGGVIRTQILLRMGEIAAQVNKSEATKSDFRIKSPSGGGSVRGGVLMRSGSSTADENVAVGSGGARFSVFLDPGTHALTTDVYQGTVEVTPVGGSPVTLGPGKEVEVVGHTVSPIAPIGKANARGGINRFTALNLVESKIGAERTPCALQTPRTPVFSVLPATGGWTVSVKAVAGKAKGNSIWFAAGSKVTPKNAAAKLIAGGCTAAAHSGGGTHAVADTWSGTWARKEVKGNLILTQAGATITGRYTWGDGTGKVSGPVNGSNFNGTFDETNYQGQFKLAISGRHFTGTYTGIDKRNSGPISGTFDGTCVAGPCLKNG